MGKEFLAVKQQLHVEISLAPSSQWNKKPPRPSPDAWDSSRRGPGAVTVPLLLPAKVVAGRPGVALLERWHGAAALLLLFQLRWVNNGNRKLGCPCQVLKSGLWDALVALAARDGGGSRASRDHPSAGNKGWA